MNPSMSSFHRMQAATSRAGVLPLIGQRKAHTWPQAGSLPVSDKVKCLLRSKIRINRPGCSPAPTLSTRHSYPTIGMTKKEQFASWEMSKVFEHDNQFRYSVSGQNSCVTPGIPDTAQLLPSASVTAVNPQGDPLPGRRRAGRGCDTSCPNRRRADHR